MTSWRTLSRLTPSDSRTPAAMPSPSRTRPRQQVLRADVVVAEPRASSMASSMTRFARGVSPTSPTTGRSLDR
jgi:hypothetical protein